MSDTGESSWAATAGDALLPGLLAWTKLGDGTRREAWLAWSERHWTAVVVKLPRPTYASEARTADTLRAEAALLHRVRHPGVQRLLHDGTGDPVPHLVLEYVEGPGLDELIDDTQPAEDAQDGGAPAGLAVGDLVLLGLHLASALHHLHGLGIVHRDLKPENVVVADGRPVLLDLGLARVAGTPGRPGVAEGSDGYRAPEQERGEPAAPAADLYALGVLLAEAAAGDVEWTRDDLARLPGGLVDLIDRLTADDPAGRPASAAAVLAELDALLPPDTEGLWPAWATAALPARGRCVPVAAH